MTDVTQLERRFRWLLAWYPKAFRREHEDEMLAVLMAGAGDGRRRPGLADSADLIRNARDRVCARTTVQTARAAPAMSAHRGARLTRLDADASTQHCPLPFADGSPAYVTPRNLR
jgi:hypothetical protein